MGDPHREHRADDEVGGRVAREAPVAEGQPDRPVPEVEPVGEAAGVGDRPPAEDRLHPARALVDAGDDEQGRAEGEEEHAAEVEHPPGVGPDDEEGEDAGGETDDPRGHDDRLGEGRDPAVGSRGQPDAEGGADEEGLGSGVGAVVDARVVVRVVEAEDTGPHGARDGPEEEHERDHPARAHERHEPEDDEGDEDVELLLDRKRPRVPQGRGTAGGPEVLVALDDQAPVHDVAEGGEDVTADLATDRVVGPHEAVDDDEAEDEEEPRQQPPGPPLVEGEGVDVPAVDLLLDEQPGDEEGGEDEEEVDAHPHARELVHPEVVGHEAQHEEPTDTVERRAVPEA